MISIQSNFILGFGMLLPHASLELINQGETTALYFAVEVSHAGFTRSLITQGADPLIPSVYKDLPMHHACKVNHVGSLVELLKVKQKDQLVYKNQLGRTPLFVACLDGAYECVVKILECEFSQTEGYLLEQSDANVTALMVALVQFNTANSRGDESKKRNYKNIMIELLKFCPAQQLAYSHKGFAGFPLLSIFHCSELWDVVDLNSCHPALKEIGKDKGNVLHYLVKKKYVNLVKQIISIDKALVLKLNEFGMLPINISMAVGSIEVVKALLTVNKEEQIHHMVKNTTLVAFSLSRLNTEMFLYLLSIHDYDLNVLNAEVSYLDYAVAKNKVECAR